MYQQAWPWPGTASASSASGYVQPTASTQVATTQWPAGYGQYAVTPEIQQQWAAAWQAQAQYAYGSGVPVGDSQTAAYTGAYPDYQAPTSTVATTSETQKSDDANSTSDKPKNSAEQPVSQDLAESDKIRQLKEQAEKWTSLQQPAASSWSSTANTASPIGNTTTVTAPNDSTKSLTSTNVTNSGATQSQQMSKEEEDFERQFKDWEQQFETWKQQNQNHPDKEAFAQYEKQWQEWRVQLLQKKEQMQKAKAEQMTVQSSTAGSAAGFVTTQPSTTNITDTTAATTAGVFYQHPQYMYMHPQYMYPGTATVTPVTVPPAVVPSAVVPPAIVPPNMVAPAGVPAVSMPPGAVPPPPPQQMSFNAPPGQPNNYGNQPPLGMSGPQDMNYENQGPQDYENERGMYNYGMQGNGPRDERPGMGPGFEGYENPNMNMPEGDFPRDNWKFSRGRGRGGRGRARGRGSRWGEPTDMDARQGGAGRTPRKTLLPGPPGPGTTFPEDDGPPPFEYPTEDCRDQFKEEFPGDRHGNQPRDDRFDFQDGPQQYPPNDGFPPQQFDDQYPPEQEFPDRFPPDRKRFPQDQERFPPGREGFPPGREGFPPGREGFLPGREKFPPGRDGFPPGHEGFPPGREGFPPGREGFPPGREGFPRGQDRFPPDERFPPDDRFPPEQDHFPPDHPPPKGGRFPPDNRFPPEDNRFPPEDERFPPGPERFPPPPRHMMDEGGFRDFDQYPPEDEMYGPPPFHDDFPPFEDRGGRGRGRFQGRGRRFHGEFERYGPQFPPRMRNESFGPQDFPPPDDRFGFPNDGPPRIPPPRGGMRPPFEPPPFGPEGRFPDDSGFFGDENQRSIDYSHRPAADVMGDDYNPNYEFESEFQDDVNAYRARPAKRKKKDDQRKSAVEKKTDTDKEKDMDNEKPKDNANDN